MEDSNIKAERTTVHRPLPVTIRAYVNRARIAEDMAVGAVIRGCWSRASEQRLQSELYWVAAVRALAAWAQS